MKRKPRAIKTYHADAWDVELLATGGGRHYVIVRDCANGSVLIRKAWNSLKAANKHYNELTLPRAT